MPFQLMSFQSSRSTRRLTPRRAFLHPLSLKCCGGALAIASFLMPVTAKSCQTECKPRTAVMTAYSAEINPLIKMLKDRREYRLQGVPFTVGTLNGEPVVIFMTGISMTNAAMNTQRVLDQFNIRQIVFSGIAGSVDADQNIGDVVIPSQWATYGESLYARETAYGYQPSEKVRKSGLTPYGMIYPRVADVLSARSQFKEERLWFPANNSLLALAKKVTSVALSSCATKTQCTRDKPVIRVGGAGVSAAIFMDNADYRDYLHDAFGAHVADMESAAAAQVAYANQVPFIAFRSVSDLAGGGDNENEKHIYSSMAADNAAKVVRAFIKQLAVSPLSANKT